MPSRSGEPAQPPAARLRVRVSPGARGDRLVGRHGEGWKVRVAAPAERGRANEAVLRLLAEALEVPRDAIRLVAGATGRDKVIEAQGITTEDAERRLAARGRKGEE
jgi:uncharacterized protein (TIGR00251 family)